MKFKKIVTVLISILLIISCKKKTYEDPTVFKIGNIPVQDSVKLMVVLTDEITGASGDNDLFVITKNDKVKKQNLTNTSGNNVSDVLKPESVANATPDYMIITFTRSKNGAADEGYFINKRTGALVSLGDRSYIPKIKSIMFTKNYSLCQYDGQRYLYYLESPLSGYETLIKYDMKSLVKTNLLPDSIKTLNSFDVDINGNLIVDVDALSGKRWFYLFNQSVSQKLDKISVCYWVANDGIIRNRLDVNTIQKFEYDPVNKKFVITKDVDMSNNSISNQFVRDDIYKVFYQDKTFLLSKNELFEFYPVEKKIKQITTVPIIKTKWVDHSKALGHMYVAGESASGIETIFNIDLSNYSYKTYPEAGKYSFYEIEAFEDGTIYATAKRKSDNKNVILKFAPDGTETVLYDNLGTKKGVWLEKVTEFVND